MGDRNIFPNGSTAAPDKKDSEAGLKYRVVERVFHLRDRFCPYSYAMLLIQMRSLYNISCIEFLRELFILCLQSNTSKLKGNVITEGLSPSHLTDGQHPGMKVTQPSKDKSLRMML